MERFLVICAAAGIGTGFYYWFAWMLKKNRLQRYVQTHQWLLHPNAICYWRTGLAIAGFVLYFWTKYQSGAIIIFTLLPFSTAWTGWWPGDATWCPN